MFIIIIDVVLKKRGFKIDVLEVLLKRVDGLEVWLKEKKIDFEVFILENLFINIFDELVFLIVIIGIKIDDKLE